MRIFRSRRTWAILVAMWAAAALMSLLLTTVGASPRWYYATILVLTAVATRQALLPPTRPHGDARRDPPAT